jgi:hypothetical protein
MAKITWNTDCNAPGCPGEIVHPDGRTVMVQTDWDYLGVASTFGWRLSSVQRAPRYCCGEETSCDDPTCTAARELAAKIAKRGPCEHDGTDGTIDCPDCGVTADEFISAADDWLAENDGATADDPGYFED